MIPANNLYAAVVLDANILISIATKEPTEPRAKARMAHYLAAGYEFFAPGVIVSECLYVLCGKLQDGSLTAIQHIAAIREIEELLDGVDRHHAETDRCCCALRQ